MREVHCVTDGGEEEDGDECLVLHVGGFDKVVRIQAISNRTEGEQGIERRRKNMP